jgi:hypothetical protein
MGWIAVYKDNRIIREGDTFINKKGETEGVGRPVDDGNKGLLKVIGEESFGHTVAVDLINGVFAIDYTPPFALQNGSIDINPKFMFWAIDGESNIVGELTHWHTKLDNKLDENGKPILDVNNKHVKVKTDILTPLIWRPVWFTRYTNGVPCKVIGAQTTLPKEQKSKNYKKLITLFSDGRVGIE